LSSGTRSPTYRRPPALRAENSDLADRLERIAELLEAQGANPFRVGAYRRAADTARSCPQALADLFTEAGVEGLVQLPGIGRSIAALIREYAHTGRISMLDRLVGAVSAEELLTTIPGIGHELAHRIHDELGIESLEELECACHDGRLAALHGFGLRRVAGIAASTAAVLGGEARRRADRRRGVAGPDDRPSVTTLLAIDADYRRRAAAGELPRIAPRRFNPTASAWLPVLHAERDGWAFTALYSNTARAHRLGKTHDWVVIYAERDGDQDQCTVVSEARSGRRVVRGRELECPAPPRASKAMGPAADPA
jgi:hypothetical protein